MYNLSIACKSTKSHLVNDLNLPFDTIVDDHIVLFDMCELIGISHKASLSLIPLDL